MNWTDAIQLCKDVGGKLLEIDSTEENWDVASILDSLGYIERHFCWWLGVTDAETEGEWRLASNGLVPQYLNFAPGEPNDSEGNEDCAICADGTGWNDVGCHVTGGGWCASHSPICEK